MKVTKKKFGIVFLFIGIIVLMVSLYLYTKGTTADLNKPINYFLPWLA